MRLDRGKRAREGSRVREVRGTWIERRELQLYGWIEGMWGKEQGRQGASGFRDGAGKSSLLGGRDLKGVRELGRNLGFYGWLEGMRIEKTRGREARESEL